MDEVVRKRFLKLGVTALLVLGTMLLGSPSSSAGGSNITWTSGVVWLAPDGLALVFGYNSTAFPQVVEVRLVNAEDGQLFASKTETVPPQGMISTGCPFLYVPGGACPEFVRLEVTAATDGVVASARVETNSFLDTREGGTAFEVDILGPGEFHIVGPSPLSKIDKTLSKVLKKVRSIDRQV